ncbi:MAG TPA: hypothetical protein VMS64_21865 [Candidatus Methylomirabilis sp.]|nr:hypothetical protein [Candidatus Methylomirabilis sp.]
MRKGRPGVVIGAPHGAVDENTDLIAGDLASLTGFGLVVLKDVSWASSGDRSVGRRDSDLATAASIAREPRADAAYWRHVAGAAQGPLGLYVEIDGRPGHDGVARVAIATVGLSQDDQWRLKTLFELVRDSRLDNPAVPRLEVQVEPLDAGRPSPPSEWRPAASRALQIELPAVARVTYREVYTRVLGAFLTESVIVLMPKAH